MAIKRYTVDGYGQLELNNVAFRRDGRVEAQCFLDTTDFASVPAENGMVLAVDKANKKVRFIDSNETMPLALHYSSEHLYDTRAYGLKNFKLNATDDFLPRMGYLAVGDLFTTNTLCYDSTTYTTDSAFETAIKAVPGTPLYAKPNANGAWEVVASMPTEGCYAEIVKAFSMPDGQFAAQLRILSV